MRHQRLKPSLFITKGSELPLSEPALRGFLQAVLAKGMPFRFKAKGFSMSPFIKDGDVITVIPFSEPKAHLGDVVAFIDPRSNRLAVHRIVGRESDGYLIQGDNLPEADGAIPWDRLLGLVAKVEREGQTVSLGFGPERHLVAFLSRKKFLMCLRLLVGPCLRPLINVRNFWFKKNTQNVQKNEGE